MMTGYMSSCYLLGSKRPRENVIRSRIMKCQYKMDEVGNNTLGCLLTY